MSSKTAYTTVINTSGGRKEYPFLPPHGLTLEKDQMFTITGDILTRLIPSWPWNTDKDRPPNPMKVKSLKAAEDKGWLVIIKAEKPKREEKLTKVFYKTGRLGRPDYAALDTLVSDYYD